jgi:O-antigen ligase
VPGPVNNTLELPIGDMKKVREIPIPDLLALVPLCGLALTVCVSVSGAGVGAGLTLLAGGGLLAFAKERRRWLPGPVLISLLALFGLYLAAAALAAPYPHNWIKVGEELWIKLLLVMVPVLLAGNASWAERLLKLVLIMGCIAATYAVAQYFLGVDPIRQRSIFRPDFGHVAVSGFFGHHLSYAGQVLVVFTMLAAWCCQKARGRLLWPALAALGLVGAAIIWNFSRSLWLGAMAGAVVLLFLLGRRFIPALLSGGVVGLVAVVSMPGVRRHFLSIFDLDQHLTRLNLWRSSWAGIADNPLLGLGPGNFSSLLADYQVAGHYNTLAHAHNDWLMHGVNAGLPGLLAAVVLWSTVCLLLWRGRSSRPHLVWVFNGALAAQVGLAVAGLFQVYQTDDEVEFLLYFVLGLALALAGGRPGVEAGSREAEGGP